jgi:hypothetical protein
MPYTIGNIQLAATLAVTNGGGEIQKMALSPNYAELDKRCLKQVLQSALAKFEVKNRSAKKG